MTELRNPYTKEQIRELRRLNAISAKTRGSDRKDSPRRLAGNDFVNQVAEIRDSVTPRYTPQEMAEPLGIRKETLEAKMARRGKGWKELAPSQKRYKDKPHNENNRTRTKFSCGHPRTKGNSYWNSALQIDVCATCKAVYSKRWEAKRKGLDPDTVAPLPRDVEHIIPTRNTA